MKRLVILLSLATIVATLAWAGRDDGQDGDIAAVVHETADPSLKAEKLPTLPLDRLRQRPQEKAELDAFAAKSWYVAPPPPPPSKREAVEPPKPTAPPLPFAYMGRFQEEAGKPVIYLVSGERALSVGKGDVIDGIYRVEEISAQDIVFTYLPLSEKQTLNIGPAS